MDKQYKNLLKDILDNGGEKSDRTGTGTFSVFGRLIRHDMEDGFPLLTTKKMSIKSIMTELKWFLKGYTNIKYLIDNGCNIWNGDAYKKYCKSVPNQHPNFLTTKEFVNTIKSNKRVFIHFGAVNYVSDIYLNGELIGSHEGGFTPFQFEITDKIQSGKNALIVKVNNKRLKNGLPGLGFDWFNYGGITRDVIHTGCGH